MKQGKFRKERIDFPEYNWLWSLFVFLFMNHVFNLNTVAVIHLELGLQFKNIILRNFEIFLIFFEFEELFKI